MLIKSHYNLRIEYNVRDMTLEEAKALAPGQTIDYIKHDNTLVCLKVNGKPKVWKTRPNDCKVPVKYGMYDCFYLEWRAGTFININIGTPNRPVVRIQE